MFEKVKEIIVDTLNLDADKITMEADLIKDLDADSIDAVELIMALEEEFQVTIPDEDAAELTVVGDIVRYIESHQA